MELVDDRTPEQKKTHTIIWMMTDRILSGWGEAKDGLSYAGWACQPDVQCRVGEWVRSRSDAMRVRRVSGNYRPPKASGHCHIYIVDINHPSLKEQT